MTTTNYETAVVILSYNGKNYHENFFPLLVEESINKYEVVVINNASTDDTSEFITTNFPSIKLIDLSVNKGFTGGYMNGINQLKNLGYKYYILLSSDFEISQNWYFPLYNAMESNPMLAACQPKILYQKDKTKFEYAGAAGGYMDFLGYFFCRGRIFDAIETDSKQYDDSVETFWASGGCFVVRTDLFHQFGGLDLDFFCPHGRNRFMLEI